MRAASARTRGPLVYVPNTSASVPCVPSTMRSRIRCSDCHSRRAVKAWEHLGFITTDMFQLLKFPALSTLAACAPMEERSGAASSANTLPRQCFSVSQIDSFRQGGPGQVYLRVNRDQVYELSDAGGCTDLDFAVRLALIPDGFAGSRLCTGDRARVVVPGSTSANSVCRVRISRQLTPEQIAALPGAHRP